MGSDNFLYGAIDGSVSFMRTLFEHEIGSSTSDTFTLMSSHDIRALTWLKDKEIYACYHQGSNANRLIMVRANFTDNTHLWYKLLDCAVTP